MSLDAYRNSFLRVISVIIEIINYPFKLGKMRFKCPFLKKNSGGACPSMSCLTRKKTQATPMCVLRVSVLTRCLCYEVDEAGKQSFWYAGYFISLKFPMVRLKN
jgi:hypothetical protein